MTAGGRALRIGVNALYLIPGGVGGTEIYLRRLLAALAERGGPDEFFLYTNRETGADLVPVSPRFHHRPQPVRAVVRPARLLWEQTGLARAVRRDRLDVLLNPGFTGPGWVPCPFVTVFHDLQHRRHPEHFRWFDLPFWELFLGLAVRRSRRLISVSEATRKDLLQHYGVSPDVVDVVPHGVEERFLAIGRARVAHSARPGRMLLCVSTLHPHKNLERLVAVFACLRRERPEWRLVLAGMRGFQAEAVERRIAAEGLGEAVRVTGWIPREELFGLYAEADAFVYPSTFEGFGMPVLEALAAALPVGCSDIPPLREVAGNCALLFPPTEERAMLDCMRRLTGDDQLRSELSVRGPQRASAFTWAATAERTLDSLRRAAT